MIELRITDQGIEGTIFDAKGKVISTNTYQSEANLPSEIRTKLSVLRLMEASSEVHGVGQKVSDRIFWIDEPYDIPNPRMMWLQISKERAIRDAVSLLSVIKQIDEEVTTNDTTRNLFNHS